MKIKLENWEFCVRQGSPYMAPECQQRYFIGDVTGHPNFPDGSRVSTSNAVGWADDCAVTEDGNQYELGQPHPDYEAAFPNALERMRENARLAQEQFDALQKGNESD